MLPDRVSNPGPLTYESGAPPIALRGPARYNDIIPLGLRAVEVRDHGSPPIRLIIFPLCALPRLESGSNLALVLC